MNTLYNSESSLLNPNVEPFLPNTSDRNNDINILPNQECRDNSTTPTSYDNSDIAYVLNNLKIENTNRLVMGHLNINSLRNKFEALKCIVKDNLDILIISETKLDESFPKNQFSLDGYNHFRIDKCSNSGGIIIFIREDIPCKTINNTEWPSEFEGIFIEINLRKTKWLLFSGYNPHKQLISEFLCSLSKCIDKLINKYDNIVLLGDFNSEICESDMHEFCNVYGLKNLIKEPTCYKNALNPTCIDLILTNKFNKFQNSKTFETGLSDFHKMTVTVLKTFFQKKAPTLIKYRDYKDFDSNAFRNALKNELLMYQMNEITYDEFKDVFMNTLSKHAPVKEKLVRANNAPFMNKTLAKSVMIRSRLRNKFNKNPTVENETAYKIQRNLCVKLFRNAKKEYYGNLDHSILSDNKKFWEVMKPLFSEKQKIMRKIILIDDDKVIYNDQDIAEKMNNFFTTAVSNLRLEDYYSTDENYEDECTNTILNIIEQFKNHPSICKIKANIFINEKFSFNSMNADQVENEIKNLNTHKATQQNGIPAKIILQSSDIVSPYLSNIYTRCIQNSTFPNALKEADVTPIHKKGDRTQTENYRPVSILPTNSKIYERNMYDQIYSHIEKYLSPYLCGFRKGYSTQHCLAAMIESWKKAIDKNKNAGAVLTDLSKAFDCLNHKLLIAKLDAYGFDTSSLQFIYSYLTDRKQRTKVNNSLSSWEMIKSGVPQGSILGPLLFNIYMNDIFWFTPDIKIANYADDTTPYAIESNIKQLITILERNTKKIVEWYGENYMKLNDDKCHLLITSSTATSAKVGDHNITNSASEKLLGITIDNQLNFNEHVTKLCKNASAKLHALARVSIYMTTNKLRILMKAFIESQFGYCPLIWMFHSRTLNNTINRIHERALRIVYKDHNSTFQELLNKDDSVSIHHRNLQKLVTEMYKVKHNLSPVIMNNIFTEQRIQYDLRSDCTWASSNIRTVYNGTETISFRGPKTWNLLPDNIKESKSLREFKTKVKKWKPEGCTCRLCKIFIPSLGFL